MLYRSTLVGQASGSIQGATASRNRFGQYMRNRAVPVNPNSPRQVSVRNSMRSAVTAWFARTSAERASWETYAATISWLNPLGDVTHLTGQQMYVRTVIAYLQAGFALGACPTSAPSIVDLGATGILSATVTRTGAMTFDADLTFSSTAATWSAIGQGFSLLATPGQSFTRNFAGPRWTQVATSGGPNAAALASPLTVACTSRYTLAVGQHIWLRFRGLTAPATDGRVTEYQQLGPIVVA